MRCFPGRPRQHQLPLAVSSQDQAAGLAVDRYQIAAVED